MKYNMSISEFHSLARQVDVMETEIWSAESLRVRNMLRQVYYMLDKQTQWWH